MVEDITFRYHARPKPAILDVLLTLDKGELLLLAGTSGCGKTTLFRCINGLIPRSYKGDLSGRILLNGRETLDMSHCRRRGYHRRCGPSRVRHRTTHLGSAPDVSGPRQDPCRDQCADLRRIHRSIVHGRGEPLGPPGPVPSGCRIGTAHQTFSAGLWSPGHPSRRSQPAQRVWMLEGSWVRSQVHDGRTNHAIRKESHK